MIRNYWMYILAAAVLATGCGNDRSAKNEDKGTVYPVFHPRQKDTVLNIPYVADIQAYKNVEVHARIEGMLDKIYIKEGQAVRKGQLLFKINDSELQIERTKAEAAYKSAMADACVAQVEVERVQILVDKKIITKTELDLAKAKYRALMAKADVALADKSAVERRISYTQITSPFDGIVDRIPLKEGSLLASNSLLTTISDIHAVFAYFNISENEFFKIRSHGDTQQVLSISLILPDGSTYPHHGKLESAESEIDASTGNIAYKAKFENPEKILRHGGSGRLLITRPMKQAMLMPQKAVFEIQDKNYVFVVDDKGTVRQRSIAVAQRVADYYLIKGGLDTKDKVVLEGIQSLREGHVIKTRQSSL
ncbi:efflux RND transporter periplasmic adaptor subunit [Edaphocola flava]|uniref:efflux RND transporter periplasmic adaptor subunit n=1 Tax=Edaphocola flava TaxID=2499629 RepID=UPI00100A6446|nr:efflux RND transporter periplasmic adaptor subunit [Edaphocola flava]